MVINEMISSHTECYSGKSAGSSHDSKQDEAYCSSGVEDGEMNQQSFFFFFFSRFLFSKEKNKCQGVNVGQDIVRFYLICGEILECLDKQFSRKFSPVQV